MRKEPSAMREIHDIQEKIYEEQKYMTPKEKLEAIHKEVEEAREKYGIKMKKGRSTTIRKTSVGKI